MEPHAHLPPMFRLTELETGDARATARTVSEAGSVLHVARPDRLDCAVVLQPGADERSAAKMAQLAMADALAVLAPPERPITLDPHGWLMVDGAVVGRVEIEAGIPPRLVAAVSVELRGEDEAPGLHPDRSDLWEEGFGEVAPGELLEVFCRHLLSWQDVFHEDGPAVLDAAWHRRMRGGHE